MGLFEVVLLGGVVFLLYMAFRKFKEKRGDDVKNSWQDFKDKMDKD